MNKNIYVTPGIEYVNLAMATSVSASCATPTHTPMWGTCGIEIPGIGTVFTSQVTACTTHAQDGQFDFCYHNPDDASALFNS